MKIEFLSKNYTPSEKLKDVITKKVDRLDKYFEEDTKVKVMLKAANEIYTLELTIAIDKSVLRAEVSGDNMFVNIDMALPKLEKQIVKHHKKLEAKFKNFRAKNEAFDEPLEQPEEKNKVVRSKTFELTPMTVDDAVEELELVGHDFFIFLNKSSNAISVLYRRTDGNYGLIETVVRV